jgi:hypothetical protein
LGEGGEIGYLVAPEGEFAEVGEVGKGGEIADGVVAEIEFVEVSQLAQGSEIGDLVVGELEECNVVQVRLVRGVRSVIWLPQRLRCFSWDKVCKGAMSRIWLAEALKRTRAWSVDNTSMFLRAQLGTLSRVRADRLARGVKSASGLEPSDSFCR